jgi:hypothetical protein
MPIKKAVNTQFFGSFGAEPIIIEDEPTAAEIRRRATEEANKHARSAAVQAQITAQTAKQAAPLGITQTGSINLGS